MAGGLTISTLNDSSGVLATQNGMSGIAKAWVNFNGFSPVTIRGSFNVSSVVRNSTGDYTINFTTAMPDANYSVSVHGARPSANKNLFSGLIDSTYTSSAFRFGFQSTAGTAYDTSVTCAAVFR